MIGLAVLVGEAVAISTVPVNLNTLMGYLTGFFIAGFSMVINDIMDLKVDEANKADRPLVQGSANLMGAKVLAGIMLTLGLFASAYSGANTFLIAVAFAGIASIYNWKLKERGFSGNLAVASSMAIPFIYGGVLVGTFVNPLLNMMTLTAFQAGVGREVVKGIEDKEGDALRNVRSVARSKGVTFASYLGATFFLSAVMTSIIPIILTGTTIAYLLIIGMTDVLFVYLSFFIITKHGREEAHTTKKLALIGMLMGLIGFIIEGVIGGMT